MLLDDGNRITIPQGNFKFSGGSMDGNFGSPTSLRGLLGPVCLFDDVLQASHIHLLSGAG